MRVALFGNTAWFDEELPAFRQLVVGLLDEGVSAVQVMPEQIPEEDAVGLAERVTWTESSMGWLNRHRLGQLAETLRQAKVDVLHALDGRVWRGVADLCGALDLPGVFTVNTPLDLPLAAKLSKWVPEGRAEILASSEPLAEALDVGPGVTIRVVSPGTHRVEATAGVLDRDAPAVVVTGNGKLDGHYQALLEALSPLVGRHPLLQCFFDTQKDDQHHLYQAAAKAGLLSHMSFVPRRTGHRELLLRADVIVHPQPLHRPRGLLLQAMARGLPVVAAYDPWQDMLIDGVTCQVVHHPDHKLWEDGLEAVLSNPESTKALGDKARAWVNEHRLSSAVVEQTRQAYGAAVESPLVFSERVG